MLQFAIYIWTIVSLLVTTEDWSMDRSMHIIMLFVLPEMTTVFAGGFRSSTTVCVGVAQSCRSYVGCPLNEC